MFDNTDIWNDDGSRIVTERAVHVVFAVLASRIDAVVRCIHRHQSWIRHTSIWVDSSSSRCRLILKSTGRSTANIRINRDRKDDLDRIAYRQIITGVNDQALRRIASDSFPGCVRNDSRCSAGGDAVNRDVNKLAAELSHNVVEDFDAIECNSTSVLPVQRECYVEVIAVWNSGTRFFRQADVGNQQRRWIVSRTHVTRSVRVVV